MACFLKSRPLNLRQGVDELNHRFKGIVFVLADSFFGVRCGRVRFILNFAAPGQRLISIDPKDIPQGALKSLSKIRPKSTLVRIVCAYFIGSDEDSIVGRLKGVGVLREVILGTGRTGPTDFPLILQ